MSQHNIIGSEAFNRTPFVLVRQVKAVGMRRRRARTALAFVAGAGAMLAVGFAVAVAVYGPALAA